VAYCQLTPADVCGLRRRYEGAFWAIADERLIYGMWFAGPSGTVSGGQIIEQRTIEHMRSRDWGEGW
jgi:hypothetical protein